MKKMILLLAAFLFIFASCKNEINDGSTGTDPETEVNEKPVDSQTDNKKEAKETSVTKTDTSKTQGESNNQSNQKNPSDSGKTTKEEKTSGPGIKTEPGNSTNPENATEEEKSVEPEKNTELENPFENSTYQEINTPEEVEQTISDRILNMQENGTIVIPSDSDENAIEEIVSAIRMLNWINPNVRLVIDFSQATQITAIPSYCFSNCSNVEGIIIPASINEIQENAFSNCSIKNIKYTGSLKQWCKKNWSTRDISSSYNLYINDEKLTALTFTDDITVVQNCAFENCISLTSVTIPDSVTELGDYVFSNCSKITEATIGNVVLQKSFNFVFSSCESLTKVTVMDSVTAIPERAFYSCDKITDVILPTGLSSIMNSAFNGCSKLVNINFPETVTYIGSAAFMSCSNLSEISLPDGVTEIKERAFSYCNKLTELKLPESLTTIGDEAFRKCGFEKLVIPNNVKKIGKGAFLCYSLKEITIPFVGGDAEAAENSKITFFGYIFGDESDSSYRDKVTKIQQYSGWNTSVTSVSAYYNIPNSLEKVTVTGGNVFGGAFTRCANITTVILEDGVKSLGDEAFRDCEKLSEITIGNGITEIGSAAFDCDDELVNVSIGSSVTSIGTEAFSCCSKLTSIELPAGICEIGSHAFYKTGLTRVVVPQSVTSIGNWAFWGCESLSDLTIGQYVIDTKFDNFEIHGLRNLILQDGVTNIPEETFSFGVDSISIPSSVTTVGYKACLYTSIPEIKYRGTLIQWCTKEWNPKELSTSYDLYIDNQKVSDLIISGNVNSISDNAFYNCTSLMKVTISNGVTAIGKYVFENCKNLVSVNIADSVKTIDWGAFDDTAITSIVIPNGVTTVEYLFSGCNKLETVTLPVSVTVLNAAFSSRETPLKVDYLGTLEQWCESKNSVGVMHELYIGGEKLTSVTVPDAGVSERAFSDCVSITSVTIPSTVKNIGNYAFRNCSNLTKISLSDSVWEHSNGAGMIFTDSKNITELIYLEGVTNIKQNALSNFTIKKVVLPESVEKIETYAFASCGKLETIIIPAGLQYDIEDYAFSGCNSLSEIYYTGTLEQWINKSWSATKISSAYDLYIDNQKVTEVIIPNDKEWMGPQFAGCTSLESVTLPSSVTGIAKGAFAGCSKLKTVNFEDTTTNWWKTSNLQFSKRNSTNIGPMSATDTEGNAEKIKSEYSYYWNENEEHYDY